MTVQLAETPAADGALCEWLEPGLREIPGQDPLGLQTITTDRLLPSLLPGVLALSVRARYFSIYAFLLRRYAQSAGRADNAALGEFIRRREHELCIASNLCPRCGAEAAVGNSLARGLVSESPAEYLRRPSIESRLGGYGLYYRGPMEELGLVVPAGAGHLGDEATPIDLCAPSAGAQAVADSFEHAIADTRWYRDYMHGIDPIPADVLAELGESACLCRLDQHHHERNLLRSALLDSSTPERAEATGQRRRAFALLLDVASMWPAAADRTSPFRAGVIDSYLANPTEDGSRGKAYGEWAAMCMRECLQDAICSIWHHLCRAGLRVQDFDGLTRGDIDKLVRAQLVGTGELQFGGAPVDSGPDRSALAWIEDLAAAGSALGWEEIRAWAEAEDHALAGLAALMVLVRRVPDPRAGGTHWVRIAAEDGHSQPGLLGTAEFVRRRLGSDPTIEELMRWACNTFVIAPHESVANSKLPESTFRFWWEHGRLRFVNNGVWRFETSGLRRNALSSLSSDLGWLVQGPGSELEVSGDGRGVVKAVFG